jgi:hypothetical protein
LRCYDISRNWPQHSGPSLTRVRPRSGVHSHSGDHQVSSLEYSLQLYRRVQHRPTVKHTLSQLRSVHNPIRFILIVKCGVRLRLASYLSLGFSY